LVLVTFRRAVDESRTAHRVRVVEGEGMGSFPQRLDASPPDLAAELDDRAQLRHVFEGMRAGLSPRECEAASLCYLQGLSRAEAAERMGISEARMRKLMEGSGRGQLGVAGKLAGVLDTIRAGGWCEQQSSLMRAYAFGILAPGGERHALAVAHCRACPACRAHVASLRGLAAVLPLPLLSPLALAGAGAAGTGAARLGGSGKLAGSLTAKLAVAVTALVTVGSGYAVLGGHAHGSPREPSAHAAAPWSAAHETLAQAIFPPLGAPARARRSTRRSPVAYARFSHASRATRSTGAASSREFSPERVSHERPVPGPVPARSPGGSSRAAREFGPE
jgi:hypothetical protein